MKRVLKATANHSKKTFTLRITYQDGSKVKYRTVSTSKEEFEQDLNNTQNDWFYFLRSTDNYYKI